MIELARHGMPSAQSPFPLGSGIDRDKSRVQREKCDSRGERGA